MPQRVQIDIASTQAECERSVDPRSVGDMDPRSVVVGDPLRQEWYAYFDPPMWESSGFCTECRDFENLLVLGGIVCTLRGGCTLKLES